MLKIDFEDWREYGSAYWPAVIINDRTYRGDLVPDNVLNAICATFTDEPDYCIEFEESIGYVTPKGITGNVLIGIVILLVLVNIILIFIYRKCSNKEMNEDMQLQVNSAVS